MAAGTEAMQHIKFIQGMTLFVQCATEVPCMYLSSQYNKPLKLEHTENIKQRSMMKFKLYKFTLF